LSRFWLGLFIEWLWLGLSGSCPCSLSVRSKKSKLSGNMAATADFDFRLPGHLQEERLPRITAKNRKSQIQNRKYQ